MPDDGRPAQEADRRFMRRALDLAREGWGWTAPNPMVGAVVVQGNEIVGEGYHARYGEAHAEPTALAAAGSRARGATLYVTLEPCTHYGKTPPCVDAVIASGVARVVIAERDPTAEAGGGVERLQAAGIAADVGVLRVEARELNAPFYHATQSKLPWVTLKLATSVEGAIADAARKSRWLTGPESRREVHRLRANSDAIAVGIGTVVADDPQLTVRDWPAPRVPPLRVVFDSTARIPLDSKLVRSARDVPVIVVASDPDPERAAQLTAAGVEVMPADNVKSALRMLRARGVRSLLVEGGARLAGSLLEAELVQRVVILEAPVRLGPGALSAFAHAPFEAIEAAPGIVLLEERRLGDDVMRTFQLRNI